MHPRRLADALRERGFRPIHIVRLAATGPSKIRVVEAIVELTGRTPSEARRTTEQLGTILEVDDRDTAEAAAARLREVGAFVELAIAELCVYAYDPNDARRGNQPLERLRIVGSKHAHEHGQLGAWTSAPLASHADGADLLAAIDQLRARWSASGKLEAASELDVLHRVSARDVEAEQRLRASVGEQRRYEAIVYADWLQTVGDPRGSFAAALASAASDADARRLLDQHTPHLFGPTKPLLDCASWTWDGPVLDTLTLRNGLSGTTRAELEELLGLPVCACLSSLTLEAGGSGLGLDKVVPAAPCAPGLRELRFVGADELRLTGDRFERLETLVVDRGKRVRLGPLRLPALRSLDVTLNPDLSVPHVCFEELDAPQLEHLSLQLTLYSYSDEDADQRESSVIDALRQPAFAKLRTLTLGHTIPTHAFDSGFAEQLRRIPAMATLERIDLRELKVSDECYVELAARRDQLPGLLLPE
jgi:hypothetical protein